jgi:hypothetical protein
MNTIVGISIGFVLAVIIIAILQALFVGFVEIIIGTVDYIVERHKLRKINNHRKKCGLLKVEKDVSKN